MLMSTTEADMLSFIDMKYVFNFQKTREPRKEKH
jgi:hypothetical protein